MQASAGRAAASTRARAAPFAVAAILALAPLAPAQARDVAPDAPLGIATEGPLRQLFLDVTGADARPPARPRVTARYLISNSWSTPTTLIRGPDTAFLQLDAQSDALVFAVRAPWSLWRGGAEAPVVGPILRRLTTSVEVRGTVWWGGWSDQPLDAWHRLIHSTRFERNFYSSDNVRLLLGDPNATAFNARGTTTSLGDFVIRNHLLLASGGASLHADTSLSEPRARWAVALRVDAKLPVGSLSRLASSGNPDIGAGLLGTAEVGRWCTLHANVFTSAWGRLASGVRLQPRRFHHGAEISAVFLVGGWALIVEDRLLSPVFPSDWQRFGEDDSYSRVRASATFGAIRMHNQISGGVRRGRFTFWFSEDFTPGRSAGTTTWFYNSNAPDISVGLEFAQAL